MFSRRLRLAFLLMGLLAIAMGAMAWWIMSIAEHRVLRGRIAADLQAGLLELSADKQRLEAFALQGAPAAADALTAAMLQRIALLHHLGAEAERLDRQRRKDLTHHAARADALAALEQLLLALRAGLQGLPPGQVEPRAFLTGPEAVELRQILRDSMRQETLSVAQEREAADTSLARARLIALLGTLSLVLLALSLAIGFTVALRRPMARLREGAAALAQGGLDHRIEGLRDDEFGQLAACMNHMAAELARSQGAERQLREGLEREVAARTLALTRALEELGRAEAQRRQLLADIGHELRTPATVIRGEAEVALRDPTADTASHRAVLERIADTARQLGGLVEDVLLVASAQAGVLSLDMTEVPAAPLVRASVEAGRVTGRELSVALAHAPAPTPARLRADPVRLRQAIGVLLDNALRYSHPGGEVEVREAVDHAARRWRLEVLDRGIGVEAAELPRLFERGYRARAAREHRADGTGLGLAIAQALTERLGGEITLAPRPGGGTIARLSLPLLPAEAPA